MNDTACRDRARRAPVRAAFALVATVLALVGCGRDADRGVGDSPAFRVALLTPGPISDQSWNGGAYQGLLRIRDSLGARISHIQTKTPAEFEENFRQYGAQGYDLVFGHGFEFQDAAMRVGPEFPKTVYVATGGRRVAPNVAGISFRFEDPSYLAGIVAASMTRSNVVGVIGGTALPPVERSFRAFEAGVHSVNPGVRVLRSYLGTWDDASAGKEQALAQISRGADFIFQNADAAGLGVFQAARTKRGVYVFGSNADQNHVAPDVIIGSVVIDLPHAFLSVAREVQEKRFTARVVELATSSSVVTYVPNPKLDSLVPQRVRAVVDSVRAALRAGTVSPLPQSRADTTTR